ncbi:hypothetical protein V8E55_008170 [Tylopilus felleus]
MFARFSIVLIAVFAMASTSAAACSGALTQVCCTEVDGPYPKGYVGKHCKKADDTPHGECRWKGCCQQIEASGTAYYCTPFEPGNSA